MLKSGNATVELTEAGAIRIDGKDVRTVAKKTLTLLRRWCEPELNHLTCMNETYTAAHTESAIDLYELRLSWLDEADIHASAFEGVEERLCASLYHCACALRENESLQTESEKEPSKEAEYFVYLAAESIHPNRRFVPPDTIWHTNGLRKTLANRSLRKLALSLFLIPIRPSCSNFTTSMKHCVRQYSASSAGKCRHSRSRC